MKYDILYAKETTAAPADFPQWVLASNSAPLGNNLYVVLNQLAGLGWQVVSTGNFGLGVKSEIIIAHA
jgi:hypothetical protein